MNRNVAVLGASTNPERYSNKAVKLLVESGYSVFPVHPARRPIDGLACHARLAEIDEDIDTITVYLGPANSTPLIDEIVETKPRRVILNPGTENTELEKRCIEAGIEVQKACTLIMLRTDQF